MKERVPTIPVTIHLPVAEVEQIEEVARLAKKTRAAWCKQALRDALQPLPVTQEA